MDEIGRSAGADLSPTPCFPDSRPPVRAEERPAVGGAEVPVSASFSFSSGDGRGGHVQAHWGIYPPPHGGGGHHPPPPAYGEHPPANRTQQAPPSPWAQYHQGGDHQDQPVGRLDSSDPFCPLPIPFEQQQQQARGMMMPPTPTAAPPPHGGATGGTPPYRYGGGSGTNNNYPPQSRSQSGGYDGTVPFDDLSSHNSDDTEETSSSSQGKDPLRGPKEKKKSRAPRRPLTAFKLFFREERSRIVSEAKDDDDGGGGDRDTGGDRKAKGGDRKGRNKAQLADLSREIKRRWRLLTPEQKTYFEHMAREESQRYEGFYGEDQQGRVSGQGVGTIPEQRNSKQTPPGAADPYVPPSHDPSWDPPRPPRSQQLRESHQQEEVGYHPQQGPFTSAPQYYPSPIRRDTRSQMDGSSPRSAPGHAPYAGFPQDGQQTRQEQHEQEQHYYHPHPEGGPSNAHQPPPHMPFPLAPQWIDSSNGSQPVRLPPPSCVVVHDANGVPRRYQLMYAAVSMPPESASEYLMSVFSAAQGMMGHMTEENQPPPPQTAAPSTFLPPGPPPEGATGPGDPRFSRGGGYPHPHPPPPGRGLN